MFSRLHAAPMSLKLGHLSLFQKQVHTSPADQRGNPLGASSTLKTNWLRRARRARTAWFDFANRSLESRPRQRRLACLRRTAWHSPGRSTPASAPTLRRHQVKARPSRLSLTIFGCSTGWCCQTTESSWVVRALLSRRHPPVRASVLLCGVATAVARRCISGHLG